MTSGERPAVVSSRAVATAYPAARATAMRRGRPTRSSASPITGPLRMYGSVIAVCRYPAVAALPVRAWTVRTSAVATPSADTRSSVADVRCSGSAAFLPGTSASWHRRGPADPAAERRA